MMLCRSMGLGSPSPPLLPILALVSCLGFWGCADETPPSSTTPTIEHFEVTPAQLEAAGEVTVEWKTSGATHLELRRGETPISLDGSSIHEDSLVLTISETTTFHLEATSASGRTVTESRTVSVALPGGPFIAEFDAPEVVEANAEGVAIAEISWAGVERAESLALLPGDGEPIELDAAAGAGSLELPLRETTTVTLVATNEVDEVSRSATIEVAFLPVIESFQASRDHVGSGEATTLSWIAPGAAYVEIWDGQVQLLDAGPASGSEEIVPLLSATLELHAVNAAGTSAVATLEIEVGSPYFRELDVEADALWLGESAALSWETSGGSELAIVLESTGETICEVEGFEAIASSSCEWQPTELGLHPISFFLANPSGVKTEIIEVYVGDGPFIADFEVAPEELTAGEEIELSWSVLGDPAGTPPIIRLSDDRGNEYDTSVGAEGLVTASLHEPGRYEFSLEASTDHPLSKEKVATQTVLVHELPQVELVVSPPLFDDADHDEVVLSWTSRGVETLVLYEVVHQGHETYLEILGPDREAGSHSFVPTNERKFVLIGANPLGVEAVAEAEVRLAPTEVTSFTAEPTSFTQGQEVTFRWETRMADEVRFSTGTSSYLLEETDAPYLDLPSLGTARIPLTDGCGPIDTHGCVLLSFPDGFTFPFGGEPQAELWVYTPGYLAFGVPGDERPDAVPENERFPTRGDLAGISLAPFWDSLVWDTVRYPEGNVYAALLEEDGKRIFVIQWSDLAWGSIHTSDRTSSLNFQVVLHEDGRFDYRYGEQRSSGSIFDVPYIGGSSATIGFQLPNLREAGVLLYNGAGNLNGPRDHRTFSYRPIPPLPPEGELSFRPLGPQENFQITLTAHRGQRSGSASVDLNVARRPILTLSPEALEPVALEEEFRIGWQSSNANSLVVLDASGRERCTAANQAQIDQGLCVLSEPAGGDYIYTVRATGAHGAIAEREVPVRVFGSFGVASFTASSQSVEIGGEVLLEWLVFATQSVRLLADGVEIFKDDSGALNGSFLAQNITAATEFKLVATNAVGIEDEAVLEVDIWPISLGLQVSATRVRPGDVVDITVDAKTLADGTPLNVYGVLPMLEDPAPASSYDDISSHPGVNRLSMPAATTVGVDVELPFSFPYMGERYERINVFTLGYISFTPGASGYSTNLPFPSTTSTSIHAHIAPFWDSLHPRNLGQVHTAPLGEDSFAIQWSSMSQSQTGVVPYQQNLNFQLVLHRDGSFEYRFGAMEPHPTYQHNQCFPSTCVNEMNGSSATIGYQLVGAADGYNFHFGGSNNAEGNPPVPGGLANRTFRYSTIAGKSSFSFTPDRSDIFTFCADTASGPLCRELAIEAPFGFNSIGLSKEILAFDEAVTLSWQSVGGKLLRVLDGETVVFETTNLAEIDSHSIVLSPELSTTYFVELSAGGRTEVVRRSVKVDRFSLSASTGTSPHPGSAVTISWNLQSNAPGLDLHLITPMEEIPNQDFSHFDIATDSEATVLIGANSNSATATLRFEDFTFPYFGTEHSSIRVATDGYLTWATGNSNGNNEILPNTRGTHADIVLAPFWEDLHTRVNGRVLAKKFDDDHYVIQWSRVSLSSGSLDVNEGDLNFLVVLGRDGSFEYRFGLMRPPPIPASQIAHCAPVSCERETNGSSATIGYQLFGGAAGHTVHFGGTGRGLEQPVVPGGLENRGWRFSPTRNAGPGSVVVHPSDTTTYRICAYEPTSKEVICAPTVAVEVPWGIDLFQANPQAPLAGQPVTLSWSAQGLDALKLMVDGVELISHVAPDVPHLGSHSHTPTATSTTYTLEATSRGRTVMRELVVHRRTLGLSVTGPTGVFEPGETVTIGWELVEHELDDEVVMITPLTEVEVGPHGEDGYVDISQLEGAVKLEFQGRNPQTAFAPAAIPFSFPYLGTSQTSFEVFVDGYLSFAGAGGSSNRFNAVLPAQATTGSARNVHLAVFWDDLSWYEGDGVWVHAPDPDTFIVQWKSFSRSDGSSESVRYNLNFQAVLRSDGSFDYRYGTMEAPPPPFSFANCRPDDCSNETNGSSATIGYQTIDSMHGSTLHIGSMGVGTAQNKVSAMANSDGYLVFPGGLSNRTFRYTPARTGSAQVVLGRTVDQEVCAIAGAFMECKHHRTEVVAAAGELMVTELMIAPSDGAPAQWLELRNLTSRTIDLEGFRLISSAGEHRIASPLPVDPGAFVTLAASSLVHFTPDYVYGTELPLDRHQDTIELWVGQAIIASAAWGIDWEIPQNQSLSLDPRYHLTGIQDNPDFGWWCLTGPDGSPGTLGEGCIDSSYDIDPASTLPFIDIAGTGSRIYEIEKADALALLPVTGFSPELFGETYSRLWVSSRGILSLHEFSPATNPVLHVPSSVPRTANQIAALKGPLISAYWEDLRCTNELCQAFWELREVEGDEVLIVQWQDYEISANQEATITFQVQLWESGDIVVAFAPFENPYRPGSSTWSVYEGGTSIIGLENADGSIFLDAHFRRPLGLDRRAIHFRPIP